MRYKGYILLIFCNWLLMNCGTKDTDQLEKALRLSGEHRGELEKVLDYFSADPADSLKGDYPKLCVNEKQTGFEFYT